MYKIYICIFYTNLIHKYSSPAVRINLCITPHAFNTQFFFFKTHSSNIANMTVIFKNREYTINLIKHHNHKSNIS